MQANICKISFCHIDSSLTCRMSLRRANNFQKQTFANVLKKRRDLQQKEIRLSSYLSVRKSSYESAIIEFVSSEGLFVLILMN